jgi:uncharacterized protein YhbP (UPF0306 family)
MSVAFHCPGVASERLAKAVYRVLDETLLCSMATLGSLGKVHVNTAFFAWNEAMELVFLSAQDAVHCRNLERVPTMAVAVFDSHQAWGTHHRGLQLFGVGGPVELPQLDAAERLYARRFELYDQFRARGGPAFGALRFYVFRTEGLKLLDEEAFGEARPVEAEIVREA